MIFTSSDFQVLSLIGKGTYSNINVYAAKHVVTNEEYAIKKVDLEECEFPIDHIQNEISMMQYVRHKNIMPLLGVYLTDHFIHLVFPLCAFGSCKDLIQAHFSTGLPELVICKVLKAVLSALQHLHSQYLVHRSIKASHVMVHLDGRIVLSGMRHCLSMVQKGTKLKSLHDFPDFYSHNLNWASRELLEQNLSGYNTMCDIYSTGLLACELANGVVPFYNSPITQMLLNRIEGQTPVLIDANTYAELNNDAQIPEIYKRTFSDHFHDVVNKSLNYHPHERPTAIALLTHAFFKQLKNSPPLSSLLKPILPIDIKSLTNKDALLETDLEQLSINAVQWD